MTPTITTVTTNNSLLARSQSEEEEKSTHLVVFSVCMCIKISVLCPVFQIGSQRYPNTSHGEYIVCSVVKQRI